jgi:hypothetical protein
MVKKKIVKIDQLDSMIKELVAKSGYAYAAGYLGSLLVSRSYELKNSTIDQMVEQLSREVNRV